MTDKENAPHEFVKALKICCNHFNYTNFILKSIESEFYLSF